MDKQEEIREGIAELEHEQWIAWSKSLALTLNDILHKLPDGSNEADALYERLQRWSKLWIPYNDLTEEQKDQDRIWADKSLAYLHSQGTVVKVEKELPATIDRFRGQVKRVLLQAGFHATEPLIKEE